MTRIERIPYFDEALVLQMNRHSANEYKKVFLCVSIHDFRYSYRRFQNSLTICNMLLYPLQCLINDMKFGVIT